MRIIEFFRGRKLSLHSPLTPTEVTKRINRADDARYSFSGDRIRGGALLDRISIYVQPIGWDNHAGPRLRGALRKTSNGTDFDLIFGAARFQYALFGLWYAGLLLLGLPTVASSELDIYDSVVLAFAIGPLALQSVFLMSAEKQFSHMLEFLQLEAEATLIPHMAR